MKLAPRSGRGNKDETRSQKWEREHTKTPSPFEGEGWGEGKEEEGIILCASLTGRGSIYLI